MGNNVGTSTLQELILNICEYLGQINSSCENLMGYIRCIANSSISEDTASPIADNWNSLGEASNAVGEATSQFSKDLQEAITEFSSSTKSTNSAEESAQQDTSAMFDKNTDAIRSLIGNN